MTPTIETIDKIPDDVLIHVIRNAKDYTWSFFGLKIILVRLDLKMKMHHNDKSIFSECCDELRSLLKKSATIPNSQKDLKQIIAISQKM